MIVDVNAFIGRWPFWPIPACSAEQVSLELARCGIERAAICSTRSVFVHCADGNAEAEAAAQRHPDRFIAWACLGPLETTTGRTRGSLDLGEYAARDFRGVRIYPQHHSYHPLYTAFLDGLLEQATARRWPVMLPLRITMNWAMPMLGLDLIDALISRHPRVPWVLAGINYLHELELARTLMRRYETVHLETSCIMGFEAVAGLVNDCGAERILFGSGAPVQHGAAGLTKILHAAVSDTVREQILGANARRLMNMG